MAVDRDNHGHQECAALVLQILWLMLVFDLAWKREPRDAVFNRQRLTGLAETIYEKAARRDSVLISLLTQITQLMMYVSIHYAALQRESATDFSREFTIQVAAY